MQTIAPQPLRLRCGTAARATKNWPFALTACVRTQSSVVMLSMGAAGPAMPAFLMPKSSPPSAPAAVATNASTCAGSVTSQRIMPMPGSNGAASSSRSSATSHSQTFAPAAWNAWAMAKPMPAAPAVMRTRLSAQ